jgi:hypothetical protein
LLPLSLQDRFTMPKASVAVDGRGEANSNDQQHSYLQYAFVQLFHIPFVSEVPYLLACLHVVCALVETCLAGYSLHVLMVVLTRQELCIAAAGIATLGLSKKPHLRIMG